MNLRSRARSFLIQAATTIRADELALRVDKLRGRSHGLVVAMHETPVSLAERFREQLNWVSQHFTITSLQEFAQLWDNLSTSKPASQRRAKPPVLFTFDDGRESNYTVAAPVLESFGGRGLFFIVPEFSECAPDQALAYYRSMINPDSQPGDEVWEDWKPMNPTQIANLAARGHAIGNHTLTHHRLAGLSHETLEHEIGDSARRLASWTGKPIEAFGWTFGWDAIDARAWDVIRKYHRYCFAPCPGEIDPRTDTPALLWRREIEVKYSAAEYRFLYSGLVDPWWASRRKHLHKMLRAQTE
jgi:peptidoglycan/xylan/chitin deacetylase (PgdA/CDA1 family)